jgi:hypothetical protein
MARDAFLPVPWTSGDWAEPNIRISEAYDLLRNRWLRPALVPAARAEVRVPARFAGTSHYEDESHGDLFVQGRKKAAEVLIWEVVTPKFGSKQPYAISKGMRPLKSADRQFCPLIEEIPPYSGVAPEQS